MAILRQATVGASLWKFSGLLDRSKSQRLVTVPRYDRSQIDLNPGGRAIIARVVHFTISISPAACNRELPRIPLLGNSVNKPSLGRLWRLSARAGDQDHSNPLSPPTTLSSWKPGRR